ncbi:CopA family copper-resistance protein [Salinibacter ruber]|uniref:copper resistance system multicopper oxidase n=1 Tax=Salinibacter ruber TaxID=146919 RepID=UPI002167D5B6|nr:copper resistance system multicopper oxidase [Salinibacter ruber]MCS3936980.1 CopA family copper-resistance protein [Salinibacter ruber]MCS4047603.1 CopA family copper-resistance protein [Salinibacter ruber]
MPTPSVSNVPESSSKEKTPPVSRRDFLRSAGALTAMASIQTILPGWAHASGAAAQSGLTALEPTRRDGNRVEYDITIEKTPFDVAGKRAAAITMNGTVPGPLIRLQEGEEVVLRYHNELDEETSIHWHGLLLPNQFDGVPQVNYPGVSPGETFEAGPFEVRQYGTYWYHSHSGLQEQLGHYGPLVIDPADPEPNEYDREHVVVLSDWAHDDPYQILANLKKGEHYYNFQQQNVGEFWRDVSEDGFWDTLKNRLSWDRMRMSATDLSAVRAPTYTYLMNGQAPGANWTGLFQPGERVRLRVINASAASIFDVRVPGLEMEVVQVSGQNVEPVTTDEFRVGTAERYDVIVEPTEDRAYTVFAESLDRSSYARGTLAPREGMEGPVPEQRERPTLTMDAMGMGGMGDGDMGGMDHGNMEGMGEMDHGGMSGSMDGGMEESHSDGLRPPGTLPEPVMHDPDDDHGPAEAGLPMMTKSRLHEPGIGLGNDGRRVLTYDQLKAADEKDEFRAPDREIELHLTGNMERFMWGINGVEFSDADPIRVAHNERVRLTMVNDTMMNHPMHLHGQFMELENGHGERAPLLDTITVKPAERVSLLIDGHEKGPWFFHCHILYHMDAGMARVFYVEPAPESEEEFYYDLPT